MAALVVAITPEGTFAVIAVQWVELIVTATVAQQVELAAAAIAIASQRMD